MESSRWKGAITVYLSIILSAVILMGGVLMDIVRIRTAELQVRRAADTAALSVLAGFHTKLKKDYGLFALHNSDIAYVNNEIEKYLKANLSGMQEQPAGLYVGNIFKKADFINLYDYRLEKVEVFPLYNFTENDITRQQILEYMKYRAPLQLMESVSQKLQKAGETASLSGSYEKKTEIDRKLKKIENSLQWLQEYIQQLNTFKREYFYSPSGTATLVKSYCRSLLNQQLLRRCSAISFSSYKNQDNGAAITAIEMQIRAAYSAAGRTAEDQERVLEEQVRKSMEAAERAREEIARIGAWTAEARQAMKELQGLLKEEQGSGSVISGQKESFEAAIRQDLEKYEAILNRENSKGLLAQLQINQDALGTVRGRLAALPGLVARETAELQNMELQQVIAGLQEGYYGGLGQTEPGAVYRQQEFRMLEGAAESYRILPDIIETGKKEKGTDVRKTVVHAAKALLSPAGSEDKTIEKPEQLPSYFDGARYPNKVLSREQQAAYGETGEFQMPEVEFEEAGEFTGRGLSYMTELGNLLKSKMTDLGDELYVGEYILKMFKDEVEIQEASTDGKSGSTYFNKAEVEYIINGSPKEGNNRLFVKGRILLIRFTADTFHVYSNPQKRTQALELATAVAGFTGFGIPIMHNLIMCAWGTAEAISDIKEIYEGKSVPFMKNESSWKTTLLPSGFHTNENVQRDKDMLDFNYHDYLRLLLLIEDKDTKLNRMEDLLQLNMAKDQEGFALKASNTYVRVKVQASVQYWFLTKLFVPGRYKTEDGGRHKVEIEIWKGY
jgi:hypothetical protein